MGTNKWLSLKNEIRDYYLNSVYQIFSNIYQINEDVTGFFESISYQMELFGVNKSPNSIRWSGCKYIEKHAFDIENKEEYLEEMVKLPTEPDINIIRAVSMRYGLNIVIINDVTLRNKKFKRTVLLVKIYGKYYPSNIKIRNNSEIELDKMV